MTPPALSSSVVLMTVDAANRATLARLQRAHVTTVPFENLSIVNNQYRKNGLSLSPSSLYEKIVERGRGGYCFECNGLFHWLLDALGYTVNRVAARVASALQTPANHHINLVHLDRPYVVDVGTGPPMLRTPLPLDGTPRTDAAGVTWRIVDSDRPDAAHRAEVTPPDEDEWTPRYVFTPTPRDRDYFRPAHDYLRSAPESPFTGAPLVARSTDTGYGTLSGDTFVRTDGGTPTEYTVTEASRDRLLRVFFRLPSPAA